MVTTQAPTRATRKPLRPEDLPPLLIVYLAMLVVPAFPVFHMVDDWWLHTHGVGARSTECKVVSEHSGRSASTTLVVTYETAEGVVHHNNEDISLYVWLLNPDEGTPCEVRYSPTSPWRYSTNWGFDRLPSRIVAFLLFLGWIPAAFILLVILWARGRWRRRASVPE